MKHILYLLLISTLLHACTAVNDEQAIRSVLEKQSAAWNNGDIPGYMHGYWENDSLVFIGKNGPTYGYKATLERYLKFYPDAEAMGKLQFTLLQVKKLSAEYYSVIGKWELKRSIGDLAGHFTLLFRKINGEWVIVADHSS